MASKMAVSARRQKALERLDRAKAELAGHLNVELPAQGKSKDADMRLVLQLENHAETIELVNAKIAEKAARRRGRQQEQDGD